MPEGLEVELYRVAAELVVGRTVATVVGDERVVDPDVSAALVGATVVAVRRIGKLLLVDTDGPTVGLHFGMTGRIVVDEVAPIERLEYGSRRDDERWDRLVVGFRGGGLLRVNDPRRWAKVTLEPDTSSLGPDLLGLDADQVSDAVSGRRSSIKAVLLDQRRIAGLGNLCVDEVLFHAGIAPARRACDLADEDVVALSDAIGERLPEMLRAGGSHRGTLSPAVRADLPPCPMDGGPLRRATVAGRTSVWCPRHQR